MKGRTRLISLVTALALLLALSPAAPAKADVMTLGVYLRGLLEQEDVQIETIPGVPAFAAIGSRLGYPIVEGNDILWTVGKAIAAVSCFCFFEGVLFAAKSKEIVPRHRTGCILADGDLPDSLCLFLETCSNIVECQLVIILITPA